MAAAKETAIISDNTTDSLFDLVSMFSQMKISISDKQKTEHHNYITEDGIDKEEYRKNSTSDKFLKFLTLHKEFPNILASLANGKTITILDTRVRNNEFVFTGESSLLPVPYKYTNPLASLCDDNTVISYDNVNHVIKLWDLRKNYAPYNNIEQAKTIFCLSPRRSNNSVVDETYKQLCNHNLNDVKRTTLPALNSENDGANKYNLNYVLNWNDGCPSVVITYPEQKMTRKSSVVIEELPDDWVDTTRRSELLPIIYKHSSVKRKYCDSFEFDEIDKCKKPISNCNQCDKPTDNSVFCEDCNWTKSKHKITDDLCHESKRFRKLNGYSQLFLEKHNVSDSVLELKGKRKSEESEDLSHMTKKMLLEDGTKRTLQMLMQNENHRIKNNNWVSKGGVDQATGIAEEELDWKSKLRKENCEPKPAKIPKLLV